MDIMSNIKNIQAALNTIQDVCKESSMCSSCPLVINGWVCGITGKAEDQYSNQRPKYWKLVSDIKLFKELPNESTNGTK